MLEDLADDFRLFDEGHDLQKHYLSKRSRRQKGVLAFLASDAATRVFCYANSQVRREDQADEILCFVDYWKERTGQLPEELIFDSKLTVYANLSRLNQMGIAFITLRRRSRRMLEQVWREPLSAWRRIQLKRVTRAFRTPRILDQQVELHHYSGPIRQLVVDELGHENPCPPEKLHPIGEGARSRSHRWQI